MTSFPFPLDEKFEKGTCSARSRRKGSSDAFWVQKRVNQVHTRREWMQVLVLREDGGYRFVWDMGG